MGASSMTRNDLVHDLSEEKMIIWGQAELVVEAIFGCVEGTLRRANTPVPVIVPTGATFDHGTGSCLQGEIGVTIGLS
jgi:hypothetical protein